MIVQFLGLIDLIIGLFLGLMLYDITFKTLAVIFGIYLIVKGILFLSFASMIDLFAGIILITSYFFHIPGFLISIAALLLLQKAIFSFL